ncbi:hypothetical protein B0H19DRAFT_1064968 [Mycena capillaripes]|nr:hypothetical protein B0H19DRAFT_1064968 [Mycena capillaripes]
MPSPQSTTARGAGPGSSSIGYMYVPDSVTPRTYLALILLLTGPADTLFYSQSIFPVDRAPFSGTNAIDMAGAGGVTPHDGLPNAMPTVVLFPLSATMGSSVLYIRAFGYPDVKRHGNRTVWRTITSRDERLAPVEW